MSEWRSSTWGDEISLEYGKALRGYETTRGMYRVFGSNGPIGWTSQALAQGPGVILGRKGAYRGVQYSQEPFFVIDTAYYVVPKSKLDMRWLYYAIKHHKLGEIDDGSPIPSTTRSAVYIRDVEIPLIEEQRAIAHILGTLDDKIELNRHMNETLEAIARAMFKSWFVDFDPVRAKMSGEPPESICQRLGLTPDLLALFPDRLVDSELGEIPEGWEAGTIRDHCNLNAESWTAKTIPGELHYVDLANVKNGIISEIQLFSSDTAPSRARRILRVGNTVVGTVRPGNRSFALIGDGDVQLTGSTGFAVLSPNRRELRELVFFLATSDENIDRLSRLADGAAYPAVRPEVVVAGEC